MRLPSLAPSELDAAQSRLFNAIAGGKRANGAQHFSLVDEDGALVGPFGVMLHEPVIGSRLQDLGTTLRFEVDMSDRLREVAILAVASVKDSAFERYAHERVGRAAGLSQTELDELAEGTFMGVDGVEAAAHSFCRQLATGFTYLTEPQFVELRDELGVRLMIDLAALVGYYVTLAHLLAIFDVPAPDPHA